MIIEKMDETGRWCTSTPLQCRHDSGYGSDSKYYGLLELSPIRKQAFSNSDMEEPENNANLLGSIDKVNPKKLNFISLSNENNSNSSENDSGIASSINESASESDNLPSKNIQCGKDENSNFISQNDSTKGNELFQPFKYMCKDHSQKKNIASGKCNISIDAFKSYSITSGIFKSEKKNCKVDFLYELCIRNCTSLISDILSYLSDEDLRQASHVNKKWREIVSNDKTANKRRILYIINKKNAARGPNKENKNQIATPAERDHKTALSPLANAENIKQPLIFEISHGRFDSFVQELKVEGNRQILMKCPKCRYAARIDSGFKYCCTRNLCKHEFCKKCLGPFLDNHKCLLPEMNDSSNNIIVGSKKSRRNLRRLKA